MSFAENLYLSFCSEEDGDKMELAKALVLRAFSEGTACLQILGQSLFESPEGAGSCELELGSPRMWEAGDNSHEGGTLNWSLSCGWSVRRFIP